MNRSITARWTTAVAPWLVLLVVGGSSPHGIDSVPQCEAHEPLAIVHCQAIEPLVAAPTGQRLAMFGPPPAARPAISTMPVDSQLFDEAPILPGPHAYARVESPAEDTATDSDVAAALATVEDVWGQIILGESVSDSDSIWEDGAGDQVHAPIPNINRPRHDNWVDPELSFDGQADAQSSGSSQRPSNSLSLASIPEIRGRAPWLARDASLPGPHGFEQQREDPTTSQAAAAPNVPRANEGNDAYREPPTVPLPSRESVAPIARDDVPLVSPLPDVAAVVKEETVPSTQPRLDGSRRPRGPELEIVANNADIHSQRGFELAGKRAYFTARTEFIRSLRMLSEALDVHHGTQSYGQALAAGLLALEEADEFVPRGDHLEAEIDVPMLVSGHSTPVLKDRDDLSISSLEARQQYYTFAQQKLAQSIGNEVAGSMALYGLGKLYTVLGEQRNAALQAAESKAVVFHQAALLAVPQNALAANEMGVLMARYGRLEAARELLLHSLRVSPLPATWHNLSVVHARMGEHDLAQLAREEHVSAVQLAQSRRAQGAAGNAPSTSPVQWVPPEALARSSGRENLARVPAGVHHAQQNAPPTPTNAQQAPEADSSWWSRWPLKQRK